VTARSLGRAVGRVIYLFVLLLFWAATPLVQAARADTGPIKLAVFDFELDDYSAGASIAVDRDADEAHMRHVSAEVRRLIEQSGRYRLVDVTKSDAPAVKDRSLRDCNGCEAGVALALGAQQSLIGVVRRITRTEYVVLFRLRDAKSGTVLTSQESDLRMGANYAWSRGAVRLIKDRLLDVPR
jgi:Protein of unknown function (DUF2380)